MTFSLAGFRGAKDIKIEYGRVQVSGVWGVMEINGMLARWIFDRNKEKHAFYVEESYVIRWMYPYLRPAGVIMKIEKDSLPSPQQDPKLWDDIVARDRAYWDKLAGELLARAEFRRNSDAKKSFSKLRSAIAGLYVARGLTAEGEYAFKQSLELCPEGPEASFRLADLYAHEGRFPEACALMENYLKLDEYNSNARSFLEYLKNGERDNARRLELEQRMAQGADLNSALELAGIYQRMNLQSSFDALTQAPLDRDQSAAAGFPGD